MVKGILNIRMGKGIGLLSMLLLGNCLWVESRPKPSMVLHEDISTTHPSSTQPALTHPLQQLLMDAFDADECAVFQTYNDMPEPPFKRNVLLLFAIQKGKHRIVTWLLDQGCTIASSGIIKRENELMLAILAEQVAIVSLIISRSDVPIMDLPPATHTILLLQAVKTQHISLITLLLDAGMNVSMGDTQGITPLMVAAHYNNSALITFLIERGAVLNQTDERGSTALLYALENGCVDSALLLIQHNIEVNAANSDGYTPLIMAVKFNQPSVVEELLKRGVSTHDCSRREQNTALSYAVLHTSDTMTRALVQHGAVPRSMNRSGDTPLIIAAQYGNLSVFEYLLGCCTPDSFWEESIKKACIRATFCNQHAIVQVLLNKGIAQETMAKALLIAARQRCYEVVALLLQHRVPVDIRDTMGNTPLLEAARNDHRYVVELLMINGAALDAQNMYGYTPLMVAARAGQHEIAGLLLSGKASPEMRTTFGNTALMMAAEHGHLEVVKVLKAHHALLTAKNYIGFSARSLAFFKDHKPIIEWFNAVEQQRIMQAERVAQSTMQRRVYEQHYEAPAPGDCGSSASERVTFLIHDAVRDAQIPLVAQLMEGIVCNDEARVRSCVEQGACVQMADEQGNTPLMIASAWGYASLVRFLIEQGADMGALSNNGLTARDYAIRMHHDAVVALIDQALAHRVDSFLA